MRREPLGILAAGGNLPLDIAASVAASGRPVHIVALAGFADAGVERWPHDWVSLGQIDRLLGSFRKAGCRELVIAGALQRPNLLKLKFDLGVLRQLPTIRKLTRGGDDGALRRVVRFFEGENFQVRGVADVAPHLLAPAGLLGSVAMTEAHHAAIARAQRFMSALGSFDVGQAVVATADRIVAVEGVRGTDAMLAEVGPTGCGGAQATGGVLVKLSKPGQELRVDLPTIGPVTVARAVAAGLGGIAVGAGASIVMESKLVAAAADAAPLFVAGIEVASLPPTAVEPAADTSPCTGLVVLGRRAPTPSDRRDVALSRRLLQVLAAEGGGHSAVVAREQVLVIAGALPIDGMVRPLGERSHWGLRLLRSRIGVLSLNLTGMSPAEIGARYGVHLFTAARDGRLAIIVCDGAPIPDELRSDWIAWADEAKLCLMGLAP